MVSSRNDRQSFIVVSTNDHSFLVNCYVVKHAQGRINHTNFYDRNDYSVYRQRTEGDYQLGNLINARNACRKPCSIIYFLTMIDATTLSVIVH